MDFQELTCKDFVKILASKEPAPGGGGAVALTAAIGLALGNMTASLTQGKKKYAEVEGDIVLLKAKADKIQKELLDLIEEDALAFMPLLDAYSLPKESKEEISYRQEVLEKAYERASQTPFAVLIKAGEALEIIEEIAKKGSPLAVSDAGTGAAIVKSSLVGAALNVYVNTKAMKNRELADEINQKTQNLVERYTCLADEIVFSVEKFLKG